MMSYELWQHVTSGEVYVVAADASRIVAAAGPLQHREYAGALAGDWDGDADVLDDLRQADMGTYRLMEWSQ